VPDARPDILIAGASVRAFAESAALAGFAVVALDAYADLDLRARAHALSLPRDLGVEYSAPRAARAAQEIPSAAAAYGSGFENHPRAVTALARGRPLWGNPADVVRRVRNPALLAAALAERRFQVPELRTTPPPYARGSRGWLLKPLRSGGGRGVRAFPPGAPLPRGTYLQEHIPGVPGSVVFVADGRRAVPLGLSRQLVGEEAFGGAGFRYSGSLLAGAVPLFDRESELAARGAGLASAVTEAFGLVGLNGVDFIAQDGVPWPIEVNPRYTASMELVERAHGVSMFALHARACAGSLPPAPLAGKACAQVWGKAVVYARRDVTMRELRRWWRNDGVRDIPYPGERIARGRPICTVFAAGASADACRCALAARAEEVYAAATPDRTAA
jgi:predicted ATP-grasp superfamily ATP-dependent carboligase